MREHNHIPDLTPAASSPALLFVLANPLLLIVLIALLAMNAEWKAARKTKTQHAILGAVVTFMGCIPFLAVDKMPLGIFGAFIFTGLLAPLSYFLGKDTRNDETRVTGPDPDKIEPSATSVTALVRQPQVEMWVNGRWVPMDDLK